VAVELIQQRFESYDFQGWNKVTLAGTCFPGEYSLRAAPGCCRLHQIR